MLLYTWVDVEHVLSRTHDEWPSFILDVRSYWDGVSVTFFTERIEKAREWMAELFGPSFDRATDRILLESLEGGLPVEFEEGVKEATRTWKPTFRRRINESALLPLPDPLSEELPAVAAFYGSKGGVGSSTHAIATAQYLANSRGAVLLIDGNFGSPGITWSWLDHDAEPSIAYSDFLALIQSDPDPEASESTALCAERLKGQERDGIFVLPAFRDRERWTVPEIRPEHIAERQSDGFVLTKFLARLGAALGVSAVIVDLPSGLSDSSAGLMLDPRVHRVLVTNMDAQSIEGTELLLQMIAKRQPRYDHGEFPAPTVVFSMVQGDRTFVFKATERLETAGGHLFEGARRSFIDTPYERALLSPPLSWNDRIEDLASLGFIWECAEIPLIVMRSRDRK